MFAELEDLQKKIEEKQVEISQELSRDSERIKNGEMNCEQQKHDNSERHQELDKLCKEFEKKLQECADELLGEIANDNPFVQKRLDEIKSAIVDESTIFTYGKDRIKQLKDLCQQLHL